MDYDLFSPPPAYSEQGCKAPSSSIGPPGPIIAQPQAPVEEEGDEEDWEADGKSTREITNAIQNPLSYRSGTSNPSGSSLSRHRPLPRRPATSGDGNGMPTVLPLKIHKKSQSASSVGSSILSKSQPTWYKDSEVELNGSFTGRNSSSYSQPVLPDHSPPPPFSTLSRVHSGSNPPSPLSSPTATHVSLPPLRSISPFSEEHSKLHKQPPSIHTRPMQPRYSLPSPSHRQAYQTPPRPITSYSSSSQSSSHSSAISHVEFNHSNAYSVQQARAEPPPAGGSSPVEPVDVNVLYNSAVSGYLPRTSHFASLNRPYSINPNRTSENAQYPPRQAVGGTGGVYRNITPNPSIPSYSTTAKPPTSMSSMYNPSSNPQFPIYPSPPPGPGVNPNVGLDRWATSERQFTQNFQ